MASYHALNPLTIIVVLFFEAFLASTAWKLAKRKGLDKWAWPWAFAAALVPLSILVMLFIKSKRADDGRLSGWATPGVVVLAALGLLGFARAVVADSPPVPFVLPECSSSDAREAVVSAIANGPTGKTTGVAIIDMSDMVEVSANTTERKCVAKALLNTAAEQAMSYRLFTRSHGSEENTGIYFVEVRCSRRSHDL